MAAPTTLAMPAPVSSSSLARACNAMSVMSRCALFAAVRALWMVDNMRGFARSDVRTKNVCLTDERW
eukprot:CAMPEP_0182915030 /NCGR_PEP_ID=MMETSP0105_2-20130417/41_1 /TAXON_ID=81532 ORGANISM="Acanthoeca-like sp., Strain 10tr" /NCGR_SAMPLE_ID=MMETSP0105_2 /ASSEMBLY_ACC=CAM_ASM_000205 /LENGTH=66 /DNA_ID=CAMNT_0025051833 /DNA_START=12 /DNA_END=209 /DNA_ORIENTATION=-